MKTEMSPEPAAIADFEQQYYSLLRKYVSGGGESALGQAYELGRLAIAENRSLVGIAPVHHQALEGLIGDEEKKQPAGDLLRASAGFLAECLSPYEISHRGFHDAVRALRQINETLEAEIKRIAYAVHDEAGQLLVAVHLALAAVARDLPQAQQAQIGHIEELLGEVEKQLRRCSHELRPAILDDLGWVAAIRFLADQVSQRAALVIDIRASASLRLPSAMETALYRIVQEALNNVVKHANAKHVLIRAWREESAVCVSLRDDGKGFDVDNAQAQGKKGLGLVAMQERASAMGGTLRLESSPTRGTELALRFPLEARYGNSRRARR